MSSHFGNCLFDQNCCNDLIFMFRHIDIWISWPKNRFYTKFGVNQTISQKMCLFVCSCGRWFSFSHFGSSIFGFDGPAIRGHKSGSGFYFLVTRPRFSDFTGEKPRPIVKSGPIVKSRPSVKSRYIFLKIFWLFLDQWSIFIQKSQIWGLIWD